MPIPRTVARLNRYLANPVIGRIARVAPGFGVVHHVGRVSGRRYAIPVNVFRDGNDLWIALTYSSNADWVKNVLAAGGCEIESRGRILSYRDPAVGIDREKRWAPWIVRRALPFIGVNEVMHLRRA